MKNAPEVDDLVIDEAAATTEPQLCIPFHLKPKRLLCVGDPLQLPATVLSRRATDLGLARSYMAGHFVVQPLEHVRDYHPVMRPATAREESTTVLGDPVGLTRLFLLLLGFGSFGVSRAEGAGRILDWYGDRVCDGRSAIVVGRRLLLEWGMVANMLFAAFELLDTMYSRS